MQPQAPLLPRSNLRDIIEDVINGQSRTDLPKQSLDISIKGNFLFPGSNDIINKISGWLEFQPARKICVFTWFRNDLPLIYHASDGARKVFKAEVIDYECSNHHGKWYLKCIKTSFEAVRRCIIRVPNTLITRDREQLFQRELLMQKKGDEIASEYRAEESGHSAASYHFFPLRSKCDRGIIEMRQKLYRTDLSNAFIPPLQRLNYLKQIVILVDKMHKRGDIHGGLSLDNVLIDEDNKVFLGDFEYAQRQSQCTVIKQAHSTLPSRGLLQTILSDKLALGLMFGSLILGTPFSERLRRTKPAEFYDYLKTMLERDKNHENRTISTPVNLFLQWHSQMEELQEELQKTLNSPFSETQTLGEYFLSDTCKPEKFQHFVTEFNLMTPPLTDLIKLIEEAKYFIIRRDELNSYRRIKV